MKKGVFKKIMLMPFLAISWVGVGYSGEVSNLTCTNDIRPVDGGFETVQLSRDENGRYDVSYVYIIESRGDPLSPRLAKEVDLARNLDCTFSKKDPRVVSCEKDSREEGEASNSGFTSQKVEETSVNKHDGKDYTRSLLSIRVYSPILKQGDGQNGYPVSDRPGQASLEFLLSECHATRMAH